MSMLQRFVDSYDDSEYYFSANEKILSQSNVKTQGEVSVFSLFLYIFYLIYAWLFLTEMNTLVAYIVPMALLAGFNYLSSKVSPKISDNIKLSRAYVLSVYTILLIAASYADMVNHMDKPSLVIPMAILVVSSLYMDRFVYVFWYKIFLGIVFMVMECIFKGMTHFGQNFVIVMMVNFVALFCYFAVMKNSMSSKEDSKALEKKSQTDLLTNLLNKVSFEERCREYLSGRIIGAKATMFIFDFDDFKLVNDNYGHQVGDEVLKNFARILRGYFHPTDILGRIGGDEFMVLVMGELPEDFLNKRCLAIEHELKTSRIGDAAGFSCSIGICEDTRAHTFEEMYNIADSALYEAKETGKAKYVIKYGD